MDDKWTQIPTDTVIKEHADALASNNFETFVVETEEEARKKFFELVPEGSEVFTNTSKTLDALGITKEINESGKFVSLKNKVASMPAETPAQAREKRMVGSVPEYAVGSAHAVTKDGRIMLASGSGSQIPGYAYGADHVVFVIGVHKLVKDIDEGIERIYKHSLPLESIRINEFYNTTTGSNPRRFFVMNSENDMNKERTKVILVKKVLGF
ncbi:MAG TPA: LUD domain-containing protein [Patescibacteria group bacterium]|nr:LUD domain-containing protein [Patescibacteria group bacterium]